MRGWRSGPQDFSPSLHVWCSGLASRYWISSPQSRAWACGLGTGEGARSHTGEVFHDATRAIAAAIAVEEKLTALLPRMPRRSRVAPRKLSAIMPSTPAAAQMGAERHATMPVRLTAIAPATPAAVPARVTAPLVPAETGFQFVTSRGTPPMAWPISLETVSAAASAKAAPTASRIRGSRHTVVYTKAQTAATPRLARTWDAFLPARRSAVPRRCLRA